MFLDFTNMFILSEKDNDTKEEDDKKKKAKGGDEGTDDEELPEELPAEMPDDMPEKDEDTGSYSTDETKTADDNTDPADEDPGTEGDDADMNAEGGDDTGSDDMGDDPSAMDGEEDPGAEGDATSTEEGGEEAPAEDGDQDTIEAMKKKELVNGFVAIYKIIGEITTSIDSIPELNDEEQDQLKLITTDLNTIKKTLIDYVSNNLNKNSYAVNLYNLYQFKQSIVVSSEIIQKIKEFKKET